MNNIVHSINEFDVYQDERKPTLFKINSKTNCNCLSLYNSIIKNNSVNSATIINNTLIIKAISIKPFKKFKEEQYLKNNTYKLPYICILNIINFLSKQLHYLLENENKCFYTFDPTNILVVNDCKFLYLSNEHLKEIKNNNICIYNPIKKNIGYLSPELRNVSSIPIIINYKTIFYSLGLLIIDNLVDELVDNNDKHILIDNNLNIKDNKLYYFLERCLYNEPNKRFLLYI